MPDKRQGEDRDKPRLTGIRAEFREALEHEIDAATKAASSAAVPLLNGRRIAQVGASYQYVFQIENILNLPGDAPGDLHVPGRASVQATIVSVEGLTIVISVEKDLGQYVPNASLVSSLAHLMRKLIERVEALEDKTNAAGDRLMGRIAVSGEPAPCLGLDCDEDKTRAVEMAVGRDTTFIWGPPGTGKTYTIGAIGEQLVKQGRSLLLVSHTNTAVDGALLEVAKRLGKNAPILEQGKVVRVGDPVKPELQRWGELLAAEHVKRRSAELMQRREQLEAERTTHRKNIEALTRQIDLCEWVAEATPDIGRMQRDLRSLQSTQAAQDEAMVAVQRAATKVTATGQRAGDAREAKRLFTELASIEERQRLTAEQASAAAHNVLRAEEATVSTKTKLDQAKHAAPLRAGLARLPSIDVQEQRVTQVSRELAEARECTAASSERLKDAESLLREALSVGVLTRMWRRLPAPDEQTRVVERARLTEQADRHTCQRIEDELGKVRLILDTARKLTAQLQPYAAAPAVKDAREELRRTSASVDSAKRRAEKVGRTLSELCERRETFLSDVSNQGFESLVEAEEAIGQAEASERELRSREEQRDRLRQLCIRSRQELDEMVVPRLHALIEWGLLDQGGPDVEAQVEAISNAFARAKEVAVRLDVATLRQERSDCNRRIESIDSEVQAIDDQLRDVEEAVIRDATVVATTLTRAYLRDAIQKRRFDTVILDEASMAPIPALWVAASLADRAAVAVGDFKQLPPIVISNHPIAKRWLGTDIFVEAGVASLAVDDNRLARLRVNRRMRPEISAIVNELIYGGWLRDHESTEADGGLDAWYALDWGHDSPVLLVNTEKIGAWVTSVKRGSGSSRLNFLSATLCVDIAERILRDDRPAHREGEPARILIISPYRPHARLIQLMLREQGFADTDEVRAGTAHSFQGSELSCHGFQVESKWVVL